MLFRSRYAEGVTAEFDANDLVPMDEPGLAVPRVITVLIDQEFEPVIRLTLEMVDGRPQCRSLAIETRDGGREIRPSEWNRFDLKALIENVYVMSVWRYEVSDDGVTTMAPGSTNEMVDMSVALNTSSKKKPRRKLTDEFLRRVAEIYTENIDDAPVRSLEAHFMVAPRTASMYVQEARKRGLLPPTTRGRKKA